MLLLLQAPRIFSHVGNMKYDLVTQAFDWRFKDRHSVCAGCWFRSLNTTARNFSTYNFSFSSIKFRLKLNCFISSNQETSIYSYRFWMSGTSIFFGNLLPHRWELFSRISEFRNRRHRHWSRLILRLRLHFMRSNAHSKVFSNGRVFVLERLDLEGNQSFQKTCNNSGSDRNMCASRCTSWLTRDGSSIEANWCSYCDDWFWWANKSGM